MRIALLALMLVAPLARAQSHVLVVCGIGGEPHYQAAFLEAGLAIASAAEGKLGVPRARVHLLAEEPSRDPRVDGRSTADGVTQWLAQLARTAEPDATLLVVLIGHGSAGRDGARINLPGPDLTAERFAELLRPLGTRQVVVVNAASASGDWAHVLAGPHRTVLTATRSGVERDETHFAAPFAAGLASDDADRDKDGRLSVLEIFDYSRREVERLYEREQRLRTEHPLLEADGDGNGTLEPVATEGDGAVASTLYLGQATRPVAGALAGLAGVKDSLEREVVRLRGRKASMDPAEYERRLEALLLDLARLNRELEARNR